jgi:hypothetical protein
VAGRDARHGDGAAPGARPAEAAAFVTTDRTTNVTATDETKRSPILGDLADDVRECGLPTPRR